MSDQPDSLALVLLRRIDERTARTEERLTSLERLVGRMAQDIADLRVEVIDMRTRTERIERRLDLRDA